MRTFGAAKVAVVTAVMSGVLSISAVAFANPTPIQVLNNRAMYLAAPANLLRDIVSSKIDVNAYRGVKVEVIANPAGQPDHLLVYLQEKNFHRLDFDSIRINSHYQAISDATPYRLQANDRRQVFPQFTPQCPDPSVEFISFAPNDDDFEVGIAKDVAAAAKAAGLKTVELYRKDATSAAYLNYMSCPLLEGNFYDGDSDPNEFVTNDGMISADDMANLNGAFRYKVTNIWLACQAYNDPMLTSVVHGAQAQKFAAGITDLEIGPSDQAGKCAMIGAIQGKPMADTFADCYKQYDKTSDVWGFGGDGSDLFGK